ncbi:MAG: CoA transferase [Deltaproteobacteria bacterium]|nr:CoA transferase [Deltaproteobacteria bacterium]
MAGELQGIRVIEVGGAVAMPIVGMLMGSWGAEVIHVEPPGKGDNWRHALKQGMSGFAKPNSINYYWEHTDRNKKSLALNLGAPEGQEILHKLAATTDVFLNNLRPYEMEKFRLTYPILSKINPRIICANVTGYGQRGPEKNTGGYDTVAFWARSGVMDLMHDTGIAPNISRPGYGDSITALSLLAGIMSALYIREKTGVAQEIEISLYNTSTWVLGFDVAGCLITGEDAVRPQRKTMGNPIRNVYETKDHRWIMLGMTNAQHYWPGFCKAIDHPELENDHRFATYEERFKNAGELVGILDGIFRSRTYAEWIGILSQTKIVWSPVTSPLEVSRDQQAIANEFFVDWDHPEYGRIKVLNNPIKLSKTQAEITMAAPKLGEHTEEILKGLGYAEGEIQAMKASGAIG